MTDMIQLKELYQRDRDQYLTNWNNPGVFRESYVGSIGINERTGAIVAAYLDHDYDRVRQHCYNYAIINYESHERHKGQSLSFYNEIKYAVISDSSYLRSKFAVYIGRQEQNNALMHMGNCLQATLRNDDFALEKSIAELQRCSAKKIDALYSAFVPIFRGLLSRDSGLFDEGLSTLLKKSRYFSEEFEADCFFFTGVALTKLATERGIDFKTRKVNIPEAMFQYRELDNYETLPFLREYITSI